ncbi:MAG: TonB-dependent receptor [Nitrospirota bacterium]|nr:TonB-dependent receptor [Nitrospirota bacterium]
MIRILFITLALLFSISSLSFAVEPEEPEAVTLKELLLFYDMEELTSVSFFPAVARKAPGFSYVITTEQIEQSPARTLNDIIAMRVPGMTTGGHERHGPLIGTRGIFIDNNAKTMVMLDEQQINQRSHFGYTSGLLSPLLGDIKQVEVILGPGAILHGSGALNGFINLVPKNGKDNPGAFINSEYGFAEQLWKIEAGYGASYGERKNVYLYGGMYGAKGYEPDELYGYTKTFDIRSNGFDPGNYRLSLYWNHDKFNLNLFSYENNPYKNGTFEIGWFHQQTLGIRPKYLFEISDTDSIELIGSMLWFDQSSPGLVPSTGLIDKRGGSENHWELKSIYRTTRWDGHSLAGGFSYGQKHFFEKRQFFGDDAVIGLAAMDTEWQEASVFAEDVISLTDKWTASFGLRYDKVYLDDMSNELYNGPKTPDEIGGHISPRIATSYELDPDTTIKASYQHGFRTPDAGYYIYNLVYKDAAESLGYSFPTLDIETMDSYELNFQKNFPEKKIKVNCNVFYNIFKDLLSWNFYKDTDLFTPEQIQSIKDALGLPPPVVPGSFLNEKEKVKVWGGEIAVVFQPLSNTEARISYGYVRSNADQVRYPEHQIKVNTLSYFQNNKLSLGLNYLFNSRYREADLSRAHSIYRNDRHVVDVSLNYKVSPDFSIGLIAQNVFETNVPPMVFEPDRLDKGGLGYDERRIYVALRLKL